MRRYFMLMTLYNVRSVTVSILVLFSCEDVSRRRRRFLCGEISEQYNFCPSAEVKICDPLLHHHVY